MNKFIKMPLFLGATCLIAGGLLAGVAALTDPIIEQARLDKLASAFKTMYDDSATATVSITEDKLDKALVNKGISEITKVEHAAGGSIVYTCNSQSKYEKMTFYLGVSLDTNAVDNYYFLSINESNFIATQYKDSELMTNNFIGYTGGGSYYYKTGNTVTGDAVGSVIDAALADFPTRKGAM